MTAIRNNSRSCCVSLSRAENELQKCISQFIGKQAPEYLAAQEAYSEALKVAIESPRFQRILDLGFRPAPPVLALKVPTGLGKSHVAREQIIPFLKEHGGPVYVFVPTHKLAKEQADAFNREAAEYGLRAGTIRGHAQPDPEDRSETMCLRTGEIRRLLAQGVISLSDICGKGEKRCPHHPESGESWPCEYQLQFQNLPDVIFLPHAYLYQNLEHLPAPKLVIIDEAYSSSGLKGFNKPNPVRVTTSTLRESELGEKLYRLLPKGPDNPLTRLNLYRAGITEIECYEAISAEKEKLKGIEVSPDITQEDADRLSEQIESTGASKLIRLWSLLIRFLKGPYVRPPLLELRRKVRLPRGEGTADFLYIYWVEDIADRWTDAPTLILDATLPEELVNLDFPRLEVTDLSVDMPHARIRQIKDKALSESMMIPSAKAKPRKNEERRRNISRLWRYLLVEADRFRNHAVEIGGKQISILLICQKGLEEQLEKLGLPDNVATAHFNAIKGLNAYEKVPKIVVAGRTLPPLEDVERMTTVLTGGKLEKANGNWYPKRQKPIHTRGNVVHFLKADSHPDPIAESIRYQVCEAELIQAIGRARGIRRTANNPIEIDILTNVPLPFPIDAVTTWDEIIPDRFDVILAEHGVLSLCKGELNRLHPEQFPNVDSARNALRAAGGKDAIIGRFWGGKTPIGTHIGNLPPLRLHPWVVEYKVPGRGVGANTLTALVHPRHSDPRAALEAVVGAITHFRLISQAGCEATLNSDDNCYSYGYTGTGRVFVRLRRHIS